MSWVYLVLAGLLEIVWAVAMKQSAGLTKLWPTLLMVLAMPASFFLLAIAMRSLPLGTAYMIWTGIGAIGAFTVGIVWLGESANVQRILAALLIAGGMVLMKLASDPA